MVKDIRLCPVVGVKSGDAPAMGLAGARLLTGTSRVTGLDDELSRVLSAWRRSWAVHNPDKTTLDLAVYVALGGCRLVNPSLLWYRKEVFRPIASDPTVSQLVGTLTDHVEAIEATEAGSARRCGSGCGTWPASTHRPPASRRTDRW